MLRKPIVAMSTCSTLSQACIAWPVSASGSPDANASKVTTIRRCAAARLKRRGASARTAGELIAAF
jgi:hypothetical protein